MSNVHGIHGLYLLLATKYRSGMNRVLVFISICLFGGCKTQEMKENSDVWKKIRIDFRSLGPEGLRGADGNQVSVNYEFCIPNDSKTWKEVRRIDPSAIKQAGSKGRIGCSENQWLIIGSTHQKNYQRVLYRLASLPYVERIEQTFWE